MTRDEMASGDVQPPGPRDRRRFLAGVIAAVQAAIGATLAVVLGGSVLSSSFARRRETWLAAGALGDLLDSEPTAVTIRIARDDGHAQIVDRQVVFLVRTGETEVTALSSLCTHLGCRVRWDGDRQALVCPCHGGVFDRTGAVTAGPPPAPLAKLPARIDGDQVLVRI
ncbi:MAG: ubiquinol-cytochrome c reductase iron-sulfur subunit [Vicinamibacterales bacterium]